MGKEIKTKTKQMVECYCGSIVNRGELIHEKSLEQMHPRNRNNPHCNMYDREDCYYTNFEKCPKCKRYLFADGQFIGATLPKQRKENQEII